mgnify:CR=1 FL=1
MIMFGLLTFPSNEFDLKNIAATVVPTLVDPKRRVRHAALEAVAILAAFLGPTKAVPLIRAIELLEDAEITGREIRANGLIRVPAQL